MAAAYNNVSIGTSAAIIVAASKVRAGVVIQNAHASNALYLGSDANVTTSNGLKVAAGESIQLPSRAVVYGIASGASTDVRYFGV